MLNRPGGAQEEDGLVCCLRDGRGGGGGRRGTHLRYNFMEIYRNFCLTFCFFVSLKIFLYGIKPSSTVSFSLSACIIERSMLKKSQQSGIIGTLLPDSLMSVCYLALLLLCLLSHHLALVQKHLFPSNYLLLIPLV